MIALTSRSGSSSPWGGKLLESPRVRLSDATIERLRQLAASEGMPYAEFVRTVLDARAWGHDYESLLLQRARRVAGIGPEHGHGPARRDQ